jgi:hypothetical protein
LTVYRCTVQIDYADNPTHGELMLNNTLFMHR